MKRSLALPLGVLAAVVASCPSQAAGQTLYVATYQHIYVYTLGDTEPRLTIDHGLAGISQIAVDKEGKRYAANFGTALNFYRDSSVTEYKRGQTSPFLTITDGASNVTGIAVDEFGDVFASSYYLGTVSVYLRGQTKPVFTFKENVENPGLLFLQGCHLYVQAGSGLFNTIVRLPESKVLTITAPGELPQGALTNGGPFGVADDGTVYAGGYVTHYDFGYEEFVDVFPPGATEPHASVIVRTGNNADIAPYVAVSGDSLFASASDINTVFEYSISKHLQLVRTITDGLNQPGPLAVDAEGNLYVASATEVTVYPPKATSPSQTLLLPEEIGGPVDILIAK